MDLNEFAKTFIAQQQERNVQLTRIGDALEGILQNLAVGQIVTQAPTIETLIATGVVTEAGVKQAVAEIAEESAPQIRTNPEDRKPVEETVPPPPPVEEKKPSPPPAAAADAGKAYTLDQVRNALKEYRAIEGAPAMLEVLKTHGGAASLTEVKPENYAAIMAAVSATE